MGRKAFFIDSKLQVYDYATCDKCGLKIKDVQDGKKFYASGFTVA
jgi:DNA-directed RNA polymerase subunit RPC12/RpoP